MNELERAVEAIEHGLLPVTKSEEQPAKKIDLRQRMVDYKVPGVSVAFVYDEAPAWARGYGVVEKGGEKPVTADTIFQAASISKAVTAMVALHLVEGGSLDLDADVNDVLHSWKVPESKHTRVRRDGSQPVVTLRGLLAHSAGLGIKGYTGYTSERQLPTLQQILNGEEPANSKAVRVVQRPWKVYKYSSGGCLEAGQGLIWMTNGENGRKLGSEISHGLADVVGWTWW